MFWMNQKQTNRVLAGLIVLMAATRFHHFGTINTSPDASLVVFFMAGLYVCRRWVFPLLVIEAGLIDYVAITQGGVSDYCMSAGYAFLIPAYAVLLLTGRKLAGEKVFNLEVAAKTAVSIIAAVSIAFLISNAGFYLFSDNVDSMGVFEYFTRVIKYYPPYLTTTLVYAALILGIHWVLHYHVDRELGSRSSVK